MSAPGCAPSATCLSPPGELAAAPSAAVWPLIRRSHGDLERDLATLRRGAGARDIDAAVQQMERIHMLERAASARAAKEARDLPTGRPPKMTAQQRAAAAAMIASGIKAEDVAAGYGEAQRASPVQPEFHPEDR
ncbi:hypothetical protein ACFQVD_08925 [Streptosporangium amethystogenes subsp. fukuiense]|uniref:Uncharacterized protein n=1 Tax=Streptosporangium amethystogenes subsp. fukuiense TaxID=698418 RepID=A0ABW2SVA1_9ACTN